MINKMKKIILGMFLFLPVSISAYAMPVAIDDCVAAGDCIYGGAPFAYAYDGNLIAGHYFVDNRSGSFETKVLMEYQLGTSSRSQGLAITGSLWLELNQSYSLSDSLHAMTLHFDQTNVVDAPQWVWGDNNWYSLSEQRLNMTTDGLLSGYGEVYIQCCEDPYDPFLQNPAPFSESADIAPSLFDSNGDWPLICVADGCDGGALLNLIGLQYVDAGATAELVFNSGDTRSLVYYTTGYTNTVYSVSAVPVPAAVWLFASGLLSLLGVARKK